jgi:hypothetical protein
MDSFDFSGWATRNDLLCGDGRTIRKDAFKDNDGQTVPLIWNHDHTNQDAVLGHALLENRADGVYAYCKLNETEQGLMAKQLVQHGDVRSLSIYANKLKQIGGDVVHGSIRELSLVLAGANPGASIDVVMAHSDEDEESMIINYDESALMLYHSDDKKDDKEDKPVAKEEVKKPEGEETEGEETVGDVLKTLTEKQMTAVTAVIGMALEHSDVEETEDNEEEIEGGNATMKHNVFDKEDQQQNVLSHSDQSEILKMAKSTGVGSLQAAISAFAMNNETLKHNFVDEEGNEAIETLFPDYKDVRPGAPEKIERDQGWVSVVMNKVHKSPISRIRTRQADVRGTDLRALGYKKGDQKKIGGAIKLLNRTTDPQTVYRKDELHRDDITDITDFDVVAYLNGIMRQNLNEEIATAIMIGDGREDGDADKIHEDHIRSVWHDAELYTIHQDVDIAKAKAELQGTNTGANFGENYIYAEAIIQAALYSREKYKGSGTPDFYCTPHLLNVMLLARDLNGRRIYDSKADLTAALNVGTIYTCEQFEGKTRTTEKGETKKLLGLFVNLADYQVGSTKGGEITRFSQFDIDFNKEKYLIETRLSGALTRVFSAIALEEPVEVAEG